MIPADVASRLRLVLPDQPAPTQPPPAAGKLADVLSEFVPGQRLMAEIQAMLPNGVYRAVVAQRDITLALPFSAKPGDALELEVVDSDGKLTLAFVANRSAGEAAALQGKESASTTLSAAGKLIGDLMGKIDDQGKRAPPAPLNANQPLFKDFPKDAAQLAPVLKEAISKSGMFYEAHQARWVEGKLPTAALLQEPQGKLSSPAAAVSAGNTVPTAATQAGAPATAMPVAAAAPFPGGWTQPPEAAAGNPGMPAPAAALPPSGAPAYAEMAQMPESLPALPQTDADSEAALLAALPTGAQAEQVSANGQQPAAATLPLHEAAAGKAPEAATALRENPSGIAEVTDRKAIPPTLPATGNAVSAHPQGTADNPIPVELTPLVRQQLDALATQNFVWQGQVWPGQQMHWEIEEDHGNRLSAEEAEAQRWLTRLKLNLPGLGGIDAVMRLTPGGALDVALVTDQAQSRQTLITASDGLRRQLDDAGLQLTAFSVRHGESSL